MRTSVNTAPVTSLRTAPTRWAASCAHASLVTRATDSTVKVSCVCSPSAQIIPFYPIIRTARKRFWCLCAACVRETPPPHC